MEIAVISSWVMRGSVGLRATQFALERRGATVWGVPTVLLPWHPGLGRSTLTLPPDFAAQLNDLSTHAAALDAVVTGYFGSAEQVHAAARFIDAVRAARPDALIVVDPVIGDNGGRYVPDAVAEAIAAELIPRADLATPNRFELADLTGGLSGVEGARALGPATVIATSAEADGGQNGAILVQSDKTLLATHPTAGPARHGTGDLFMAVAVSALTNGLSPADALRHAAAATYAVVNQSVGDELALAEAQQAIETPPLDAVTITRID